MYFFCREKAEFSAAEAALESNKEAFVLQKQQHQQVSARILLKFCEAHVEDKDSVDQCSDCKGFPH